VYTATLFGIPLYRIQSSSVPGYAALLFSDPDLNEAERAEVKKFVDILEGNGEYKKEAMGKSVAIVNGEVATVFFNSASEALSHFHKSERCFVLSKIG